MNCPKCNSIMMVPHDGKTYCLKCNYVASLSNLVDCVDSDPVQFCPLCGDPVEVGCDKTDTARLCEVCGWWGDASETLPEPPPIDGLVPRRAVAQVLRLYRDVCRRELVLEQAFDLGEIVESDLQHAKNLVRNSVHEIIKMVVALMPRVLFKHSESGMVPWPEEWEDRHYNGVHGCGEPCDMLVGPCACGAFHLETEEWVVEVLLAHNTKIV